LNLLCMWTQRTLFWSNPRCNNTTISPGFLFAFSFKVDSSYAVVIMYVAAR
jgi:hypothetical protein